MFCSVDKDLNAYYKKMEEEDRAWDEALEDAYASQELEEEFNPAILDACDKVTSGKMSYEDLGLLVMRLRDKAAHDIANIIFENNRN